MVISFQSLDDPEIASSLIAQTQNASTTNFVLDFGEDGAYVTFDLGSSTFDDLMDIDRPDNLNARWINIWYPQRQKKLIETIARTYDFSPRLLGLMCSDPKQPHTPTPSQATNRKGRRFWTKHSPPSSVDAESSACPDELSEHSSITSQESSNGGNIYRIVNDLWHYSSIDFGRNYVCLGYNSLYGTKFPGSPIEPDNNTDDDEHLPHCHRVWTWLLLCSDSTIITINEDPFPYNSTNLFSHVQKRIFHETRRNLTNVFRSLSLSDSDPLNTRNPMALLPLRTRLGDTREESAHRASDTPGLLFYYLFENWHNSYTLITRKESRYGVELASLRKDMLHAPKLAHIDRLDRIGKELGVLRRHYEAYNRLIVRVLEPVAPTNASLENSRVVTDSSDARSVDTVRGVGVVTARHSTLGVSLSSPARVRFARLKDLIDLYALNEIDEYLKQKESLVSLNFSLLTLKESLDVEHLTRITLLLTKFTILFLPASLVMAYFSVPLEQIEYTIGQFWVAFTVVFVLSWSALVTFGIASNTLQIGWIWRGMVKGGKGFGRRVSYVSAQKREPANEGSK
ncbi:hypothetical protein Q7P37_001185 [Cladosporium fusiforme]